MSSFFSCQDDQYSLFQGVGTINCHSSTCGQFSVCSSLAFKGQPISEIGCCREGILYPNAVSIIMYILIIPVIGVCSLGALGGGVFKRPILEAILNINSSTSGDITACLMFSAQLVNQVIIFFQSHPDHPERPLVNFEIGLVYALGIPISMQIGMDLANYLPLLPLLTIQMIFFVASCPVLLYFAKSEEILENKKDKKIEVQPTQINTDDFNVETNMNDEQRISKIFKQFQEESTSRFPILPILLAFGNFALNESIILLRTTSYQTSPYFYPNDKDFGDQFSACEPWNFYVMLLLFGVNFVFTLLVFFYMRKQELLKNTVQFNVNERYFTPRTRFFMIYGAGWATGFIAGFLGMAAGLTMLVTLMEFNLVAAAAGATANYGYFIICLQVFISFIVKETQDLTFQIGYQFFFYGIGAIGVLIFTNLGFYMIKKYNIEHIVFYVDFALVLLNMIGNVAWGIEQSERFSYHSLVYNPQSCTAQILSKSSVQ
ncbi:unnamed protein product (macronuclear) [Paramecium tetraurelia]|uniref:Uncharacterized protein n=1 Tax=Paramecium tetraurelia TaxID=5888 RepID=A0DYM7_PARTE|nr:uncharacterized protein GSPATT00003112001 [Paramecium tetraurelia]CAK88144.1 unnamed protein product [Paramecium tetraurelia]|eukprot:XP_001455541.1 hypothetical protein (macronuclear) [Paramecium tetraurelia strain d4-2]